MKAKLKPSTPRDYFERTSHVVRHLYLGIASCHQVWEEATAFWTPQAAASCRRRKRKGWNSIHIFCKERRIFFKKGLGGNPVRRHPPRSLPLPFFGFPGTKILPESCRPLFKGIRPRENQLKFCIGKRAPRDSRGPHYFCRAKPICSLGGEGTPGRAECPDIRDVEHSPSRRPVQGFAV